MKQECYFGDFRNLEEPRDYQNHQKLRPSREIPSQLAMFEKLLEQQTPRQLLLRYKTNRFVEPSDISQREKIFLEHLFYSIIPDNYEAIELPPVAPLGLNSTLAPLSQKMIISAVRNLEVLADSTTMMAFEIAKRGYQQPNALAKKDFIVNLSNSARLTRAQLFPEESGFRPHFQAFALASGGIVSPEIRAKVIEEHLSFFLEFLQKAKSVGYVAKDITVYISNIMIAEKIIQSLHLDRSFLGKHSQDYHFHLFQMYGLELPGKVAQLGEISETKAAYYGFAPQLRYLKRKTQSVIAKLGSTFPEVHFKYDLERIAGIGYYNGVCYKITARDQTGNEIPLADGGYSDWLAKFLLNKKAFFCSGGFGLELFAQKFKNV